MVSIGSVLVVEVILSIWYQRRAGHEPACRSQWSLALNAWQCGAIVQRGCGEAERLGGFLHLVALWSKRQSHKEAKPYVRLRFCVYVHAFLRQEEASTGFDFDFDYVLLCVSLCVFLFACLSLC